jgi:uncharacterized protein
MKEAAMNASLERRDAALAWPEADFEVRSINDGLEFSGYAAVFDSESEDLGGFREVIRPGAFARSINAAANGGRVIKAFLNHNQDIVLGSTRAKTLRLSEDARGLLAEVTLPDSTWGHPVAEAVRRGDISSMSFGFIVPPKGDSWSEDHKVRTVHEVRLLEVSPVTGWPAYTATTASVRHLIDAIDWEDEASAERIVDGLGPEQRAVLLRVLNRQSPSPLITPSVAELMARLESKRAA